MPQLRFRPLELSFAICRFAPTFNLPTWASESEFFSITRTLEELSIVCPEAQVPPDVMAEFGWKGLMLEGPFDFGLTGILTSVLVPLAEAQIGIFAFSTFDTDYVLVKEENFERALEVLTEAGHLRATPAD